MSITFDAGALIALDRNDREVWAALRRSLNRSEIPTVPTVVITQAWRDGVRQARLAQALKTCRPEPLEDQLARRAGELCGRAGTADVVDAVVVSSAALRHDVVLTTDVGDLEALADHLVAGDVTIVGITRR